MVKLKTNHGDILLDLDAEKAPLTVENFLQYVKDGFFTNTLFHAAVRGSHPRRRTDASPL